MKQALFSSLYLAPIAYYKALLSCDEHIIEQYNHYERKTYQNRCEILSANGIIALSVPVEKTSNVKTPFKEIRIAYHTDWQKQHLKALTSAYMNSPFYEYYIDDFRPLYEQKFDTLMAFNLALHELILELIEEPRAHILSSEFCQNTDLSDLRFAFTPKTRLRANLKSYTQVFSGKLPFEPNLSILDLLFNLGPETELYLKATT